MGPTRVGPLPRTPAANFFDVAKGVSGMQDLSDLSFPVVPGIGGREQQGVPVRGPAPADLTPADLAPADLAPADLVDRAVLADLRAAIAVDVLLEVVDDFESDMPARMSAISGAVCAGDARWLAEAAHALRGSSAGLGAAHLAKLSARLEELARAGDLARAPALVEQLGSVVRDTPAALRATLAALPEELRS